jgi:hypothetical protein
VQYSNSSSTSRVTESGLGSVCRAEGSPSALSRLFSGGGVGSRAVEAETPPQTLWVGFAWGVVVSGGGAVWSLCRALDAAPAPVHHHPGSSSEFGELRSTGRSVRVRDDRTRPTRDVLGFLRFGADAGGSASSHAITGCDAEANTGTASSAGWGGRIGSCEFRWCGWSDRERPAGQADGSDGPKGRGLVLMPYHAAPKQAGGC